VRIEILSAAEDDLVAGAKFYERSARPKTAKGGCKGKREIKPLLPYFVLGGLQGLRTCEMVRERADYPVVDTVSKRV
jgi:hypothetical protein